MKLPMLKSRLHLLGVLIVLLLAFVPAHAQSVSANQQPEAKPITKPEGEAGEVKELKSKVEQLQLLIEQQQRVLAEMQKRVDDLSSARVAPVVSTRPDGTAVVSADLRAAALETNQPVKP